MAIVLDFVNDVETDELDFIESLKWCDGIRCCLDVNMINGECIKTSINELFLVPLDDFSCKRTIKGNDGTDICVNSSFGLMNNDFIDFNFKEVELLHDDKYHSTGLLISNDNFYYPIVAKLSKHFGFLKNDCECSFILDESELSRIQLVPFILKYANGEFRISNIETEMSEKEFDAIFDDMYSSDILF